MRVVSPYLSESASWFRGNLHTHTTQSDGPLPPQATVDAYAARGYEFLAVSDHDQVTALDTLDPRGMTLLSANEITADGPHMLHIGAHTTVAPNADRQKVIDAVKADGGFAVMNHPNWLAHFNHCPQEVLEACHGYAGIEIYNAVVEWIEGSPLAVDRWDRLLSQGRQVWGYANDDCHRIKNIGVACNMVQATSRTPEALLEALAAGRFYATTGVTIESIRVCGASIHVRAINADRVIAVTDHGRWYMVSDTNELMVEVPDDFEYSYLRFECLGPRGSVAWTQPMWLLQD